MNQANLISIIMPCYNDAAFVSEAVQSAFVQSYPHIELVAVDDGSTDSSPQILGQLADAHQGRMRVLHQENQGPYPARNLGLAHARGEYIAFLDADDLWHPECLSKLHAALTRQRSDLAYCGWQNIGEKALGTQPYIPPAYETVDTARLFLQGCPWPIHAALIRRELIESLRGFSERYYSCMDYDLWLRILALSKKLVQVPEVLAYYRWHEQGQISATPWKQALDSCKVRRDFIRENPQLVAHLDRKSLRKSIDGCILENAFKAYWQGELGSAQRLFRNAFKNGYWTAKDLKHLLPSLLPERLYRALIGYAGSQKRF